MHVARDAFNLGAATLVQATSGASALNCNSPPLNHSVRVWPPSGCICSFLWGASMAAYQCTCSFLCPHRLLMLPQWHMNAYECTCTSLPPLAPPAASIALYRCTCSFPLPSVRNSTNALRRTWHTPSLAYLSVYLLGTHHHSHIYLFLPARQRLPASPGITDSKCATV